MTWDVFNGWFGAPRTADTKPCSLPECCEQRRIAGRVRRRHARAIRDRRMQQQAVERAIQRWRVQDYVKATRTLARTIDAERMLASLAKSRAPRATDAKGRRLDVVISSFQLRESFQYCVQTRDEGMHFLVGYDLGRRAFVSGMRTFPYESRSVVHATGDPAATHRIVRDTHDNGHRVLLIVHAHPGSGPDANFRSARDMAGQRKWEPWNRQIGGIWSRDGYLRFFSWQLPFSVRIKGTHLEQVEDTLWRIKDVPVAVPNQTPLALSAPE